ncbi:hypothetical protein Enr13x_30470 [Stieleria neptunia]|uniref:Macro domain-containing protein n=1 Tax=Stieleria neptunia TaxID=2527979 RepID=A0A518HQR8_9BACT|nr:hypothetical protein [Stieleria neptunia]QDV43192.1 hypothetical protein Enr13x_30470 [Stieleria neptunia]
MTWFEQLTGIKESSPDQVRSELAIDGECIVCPNGQRHRFGTLQVPTLGELRSRVQALDPAPGRVRLSEVVGDVRQMHADVGNAGATFQVASQFNLLEMASPSITPESGVGIYENDRTQGPACAISCGAGTIYRNYFVPIGDQLGQSADRQIDCASDLGSLLGNETQPLWTMENGYLFPSDQGLQDVTATLRSAGEAVRDDYRASLRIGIQSGADVTLPGCSHQVTQLYCSALPVAYGSQPTEQWHDFANLVLEAAYESTFCAAILNAAQTGCNKLYLTLLGGGVFGNRYEWITGAIERAATLYRHADLDVAIVSYGRSNPAVRELMQRC